MKPLLRSLLLPAVAAGALLPPPAVAQDGGTDGNPHVSVYHGQQGRSTILNGRQYAGQRRDRRYALMEGDSICVDISNAHPGLYAYSLDSVAVAVAPDPDLSALAKILSDLIATRHAMGAPAPGQPADSVVVFAERLAGLAEDIKAVEKAVDRSEAPEPIPDVFANGTPPDPTGAPRGFGYVEWFISTSVPASPGRFGSTTLAADLDSVYAAAKRSAGANTANLLTAEALRAHALTLLSKTNALRTAYVNVQPTLLCRRMGTAERVDLVVTAKPRNPQRTAKREAGTLVTLHAHRRHARPWLEVIPIGLTVYSPGAPRYELVRDTIRERSEDTFAFRPGALALANPLVFGETSDWALGGGIGFGVGGEGKVLSDYLGAVMLSYRDRFRFGVGAGYATQNSHLTGGLRSGSSRPADAAKLDDVLEEQREASIFLLFDFTGLKLPVVPR